MSDFEKMDRNQLRAAAKAVGIKYGKMSLLQIREALAAHKPAKPSKAAKKETKVRKERTGTKMEAAIALVEKHPDWDRKKIIAAFIDTVGLTKAGSNTYYTLVMKKVKK